jgi:adenine-specific DNA methylase
MHALGIHGDPVASRKRINLARRTGERFDGAAYSYGRAFGHNLDSDDHRWLAPVTAGRTILDPTAGGGSIPLEAIRLGLASFASDLNPVAAVIEKATIEFPLKFGSALLNEFRRIADVFVRQREAAMAEFFPNEPELDCLSTNFLWARTIRCPYCDGIVPLSPNWRLTPNGKGMRLKPHLGIGPGDKSRDCAFEIVNTSSEQSSGTVLDGDAICCYSDCDRPIDGDVIKAQAQAGGMGEKLFAIVFKRRIETRTKTGKRGRDKWIRDYRAPDPNDDNLALILQQLDIKLPEWEALGFIPNEEIPVGLKTSEPRRYGMMRWRDLFSPRQLLGHCTSVEIFRSMLADDLAHGRLTPILEAAYIYLSFGLDKLRDYNSRMTRWHVNREIMVNTFDRHDFSFKWSYAEMPTLVAGAGYDWAIEQVAKCVEELIELVHPDVSAKGDLLNRMLPSEFVPPPLVITCKSGSALDHIPDNSVDVAVMDPPYYDNVMYAELSDFFYVWLKRTAGHVLPELFTRHLSDKDGEAVANPAKFTGQKGAKILAGRDYQERMARIFEECRRVLKADGIMTLMFTHKATGAWDALTKGLMEARFTITASWPINTEAEGSLHIKNKSAANSTIFLVCRPREIKNLSITTEYWEDIEPLVARAVRSRVKEFQEVGLAGVDLYLASFGPALEEYSRHWPLKRGTPRAKPDALRRRRQAEMFEEEWDPYAVTPEDALDAARREVKRWRLEQLTHMKANEELDPLTSFFVLAWDAFRAPVFPYDEALRLARAVGVDLDSQVVGVLVEKKGSDLILWDSARRAAKGALGPADGSRAMIDALHNAAHLGRTRTLQAAREVLEKTQVDREATFLSALEAVLEVLPVSKAFSGIDLDGDLAAAGSDFEALENLRRLAFGEQVDAPKQLDLWVAEAAS